MTAGGIISITFLLALLVMIIRGIRGHKRGSEGVELDATGRAVGSGASPMGTGTLGSSEGGAGAD